jgi:hypothetical protein
MPGKMPETLSVGGPTPLNHFCDQVRLVIIMSHHSAPRFLTYLGLDFHMFLFQLRDEIARAGYTEMLTHGLCMVTALLGMSFHSFA